jgi:tripartite-type tricarboxylate transporter receptor subunit TctC
MNFHRSVRALHAIAAALALCCGPGARAQADYPSRPIRFIVPYAAGSAGDSLGRVITAQLAEQLGKAVVVDNRGGAGGTIGTAEVAHAAPDGYTLGLGSQGTLINNQVLYAKPGYDSVRDFSPIAEVAEVQNVVVVSPASKFNTIADLLAEIRARPAESLRFSSSGVGTSHHIAGAVLAQYLDKPLLHVPYTGAPQGLTAIVSGDVDLGLYNIPAALGLVRGAKLRPLAVTGLSRSALLPKLPTLDESGLKGYEVTLWFGLIAPANLPPELVARLHGETSKVMSRPEIRTRLTEQGYTLPPLPLAPAPDFGKLIVRELDKWPPIIRKLGANAAG